MGTIGATFYVIGLGLLYQATGTLNLADLAVRLEPLGDLTSVRAGFAFITVGLALKLAMFPIHAWLPNAYTYAPSVVSIFLAATSTKVAVYVMLRFIFTEFGYEFPVVELSLETVFLHGTGDHEHDALHGGVVEQVNHGRGQAGDAGHGEAQHHVADLRDR